MTIPHVIASEHVGPQAPVLRPEIAAALDAAALDTLVLGAEESVTIQDAARLTGVTPHTLRWYERVGLLHDVERSPTGRRRFTAAHLRWIAVLRALRSTGMPVATLRDLTEQCAGGTRTAPLSLVRTHRAQVITLMAMLHHGLHVLDGVEHELSAPGPGLVWSGT